MQLERNPDGIIRGATEISTERHSSGSERCSSVFQVSSTASLSCCILFCGGDCARGRSARPAHAGERRNLYGRPEPEGGRRVQVDTFGDLQAIHASAFPASGAGTQCFPGLVPGCQGELVWHNHICRWWLQHWERLRDHSHQPNTFSCTLSVFAGGVAPGTGLTVANDGNLYGVAVNDSFDREQLTASFMR